MSKKIVILCQKVLNDGNDHKYISDNIWIFTLKMDRNVYNQIQLYLEFAKVLEKRSNSDVQKLDFTQ